MKRLLIGSCIVALLAGTAPAWADNYRGGGHPPGIQEHLDRGKATPPGPQKKELLKAHYRRDHHHDRDRRYKDKYKHKRKHHEWRRDHFSRYERGHHYRNKHRHSYERHHHRDRYQRHHRPHRNHRPSRHGELRVHIGF